MQEKECITCGDRKPLSEFHAHNRTADGRRKTCIACCDPARRTVSPASWLTTPAPAVPRTPTVVVEARPDLPDRPHPQRYAEVQMLAGLAHVLDCAVAFARAVQQ